MGQPTVLALRGVLVALLAGSLGAQALLAVVLVTAGDGDGELSHVHTPVTVITVLFLGAAQVVMVCVWRLLTMVERGTVFTRAAFRYVDLVTGAFVAGALLVFAVAALLAPGEAVPPGMVLITGGVGVAALGVALVVLVLRMLLAQALARDAEAAQMQAELEEVI